MSIEIIFVRHGTTDGNNHGVLHGRTDTPLTESGKAEARQVAQRIAEMGQIDAIYSSPLQRASQTAEIIGSAMGLTPQIDPNLSEFDFGDLEGLSFDELQVRHPDLYLSLIEPSGFEHPFPNGESRSTLHCRVITTLEQIQGRHDAGRVVIVAHLIVIAIAVAHLTTGDPHDLIRYLVRNCSVTHLELNSRNSAEIRALDDVSHLTG